MALEYSLDAWQWLVSPNAAQWLELASEPQLQDDTLVAKLRKHLNNERAGLVLEQADLRRRGAKKFSRAGQMFFVRRALEQATDERIARYKAQKISAARIVDACCGIGGDLIALAARAANIVAVDIDPIMTLLARANLRIDGCEHAEFRTGDVAALGDLTDTVLHIDPDRRATGHRVTNIDSYGPGPDVLRRLAASARGAAIKLAPAAEVPNDWAAEGEREWIQNGGECRQQVLWLGELGAKPSMRAATVVDDAGEVAAQIEGTGEATMQIAAAVEQYIYDPAPAVLAARLLNDLAEQKSLQRVAAQNAYLTSNEHVASPLIAAFRVQDVIPFHLKKLKRYLREHQLGRLEIKKRGVDVAPEQLLRELRNDGDQSGTILIMRIGKKVVAVVGQRIG